MLRVSQRTVERYVKEEFKKPRPDLAARLEREVKKRWQRWNDPTPDNLQKQGSLGCLSGLGDPCGWRPDTPRPCRNPCLTCADAHLFRLAPQRPVVIRVSRSTLSTSLRCWRSCRSGDGGVVGVAEVGEQIWACGVPVQSLLGLGAGGR